LFANEVYGSLAYSIKAALPLVKTDYDIVVIGGGPAGAAAARAAVAGGLSTLLIEKKRMPRHKQCSGMIMQTAERPLQDYFGPPPREVLSEPPFNGSSLHIPGGQTINITYPAKNIWRDKFDQWLCEVSGAEVWDRTRLLDYAEWKDYVELICRREGKELRLRCSVMIAADGVLSGAVKKIDPTFNDGLDGFYYQQDYYRCDVELEPGYFHIFINPRLSIYPCAYIKDDLLVIDSSVRIGEKVKPARERFHQFLRDDYGFKPYELVLTLGRREVAPPSLNRFCMGTERVLVAGEAAGFLNSMGEGISSALATGYLAGKAAAGSSGAPPGPVYRENIKPERECTMREWYLPAYMTGRAAPELTEALMSLSPQDILRLMPRVFTWGLKTRALAGLHKGIFELTLRRLLNRDFNFRG
jgi:flavin-dependent dehydrogenase